MKGKTPIEIFRKKTKIYRKVKRVGEKERRARKKKKRNFFGFINSGVKGNVYLFLEMANALLSRIRADLFRE